MAAIFAGITTLCNSQQERTIYHLHENIFTSQILIMHIIYIHIIQCTGRNKAHYVFIAYVYRRFFLLLLLQQEICK